MTVGSRDRPGARVREAFFRARGPDARPTSQKKGAATTRAARRRRRGPSHDEASHGVAAARHGRRAPPDAPRPFRPRGGAGDRRPERGHQLANRPPVASRRGSQPVARSRKSTRAPSQRPPLARRPAAAAETRDAAGLAAEFRHRRGADVGPPRGVRNVPMGPGVALSVETTNAAKIIGNGRRPAELGRYSEGGSRPRRAISGGRRRRRRRRVAAPPRAATWIFRGRIGRPRRRGKTTGRRAAPAGRRSPWSRPTRSTTPRRSSRRASARERPGGA